MGKNTSIAKPKEQWEYMGSQTGFSDDIEMIRWLNDYGLEGWELVLILSKAPYPESYKKAGFNIDVLFKRKIRGYRKPKAKCHPGRF